MNERKLKQLNILILIAVGVGIVFMGLFSFGFAPEGQHRIETTVLKDFNDGWILRNYQGAGDDLIDLPNKLDGNAEEIILLMHKVPEDLNEDTVLVFETKFQNVQVLVGDEVVYTNGVLNEQKLMRNAVPCLNVVDISDANPGDVISVYLASGYDKYSGELGEFFYGTKGDVVSQLVRENGVGFIFSFTLLVIIILLTISLIFMRNVYVNKRKAAYGFGFLFATSLWCLFENPIMQVVTSNSFGVYMSGMILLLILPVLYIMYQRCFAVKRRFAKIFEIGIYVFAVNFLTGIVFQMLGVCDFATYMIFTKVLIVLSLLLLSGIMYLAADTYSDKTIYSNLWANLVLTIASLLEALFSIFRFYKPYDETILQIGIYIFMVLLVVVVEKEIILEMNQSKEAAISSMEQEKDMAVKNINTKYIFQALSVAVDDMKEKDKENSKLIYHTSIYMKYNILAVTEKKLVPFSWELEYIKAYLEIEGRKHRELEIVVEDKVTDFAVPFNTIEPLVENAIINGALKANSSGRLVFRSYERLDCYAIQIVDNGKGIGPDKKFTGKQTYKNIKKRLKSGCRGAIEIKNKPDKGTIVTVKIPKAGYIIKEN